MREPHMIIIPPDALHIGQLVHVEGWNPGSVFRYEGLVDGFYHLRTPKTGEVYLTRRRLLYIRRDEPYMEGCIAGTTLAGIANYVDNAMIVREVHS